jgi:hypothetical protein
MGRFHTKAAFFFSWCLIVMACSCRAKRPDACREEYIIKLKQSPTYLEMRGSFNDSLKNWSSRSIFSYGLAEFDTQLDELVFFSKDSSRAILFMHKVRKLTDRVDWIHCFTASKHGGQWWFYFRGHVELTVPRKSMGQKHAFRELSSFALNRFVEDGLEVSNDCTMYYPAIEGDVWFKPSDHTEHLESLQK